jgi:hypothetical protein
MRTFLTILILLLFLGCAKEIPKQMVALQYQKTTKVATYDPKDARLTLYQIKKEGDTLMVSDATIYVPFATDEIYHPLSQTTLELKRLDHSAQTINDALENSASRNGYIKPFAFKEEFLVDYALANDLFWMIRRIEEILNRNEGEDESGDGGGIAPTEIKIPQ